MSLEDRITRLEAKICGSRSPEMTTFQVDMPAYREAHFAIFGAAVAGEPSEKLRAWLDFLETGKCNEEPPEFADSLITRCVWMTLAGPTTSLHLPHNGRYNPPELLAQLLELERGMISHSGKSGR